MSDYVDQIEDEKWNVNHKDVYVYKIYLWNIFGGSISIEINTKINKNVD